MKGATVKSHCASKGKTKLNVSNNISNIILNQYKSTIAGLVQEDSNIHLPIPVKKKKLANKIDLSETNRASIKHQNIIQRKHDCNEILQESEEHYRDVGSIDRSSDNYESDDSDFEDDLHVNNKVSDTNVPDADSIVNCKVDRKPFVCTECDFATIRQDLFNKHKQVHLNKKPFSCMQCDFECKSKRDYDRHYKIHTGVKCFPCTECGITFTQNATLLAHMLTHTGEKLFACSECDDSFVRKDSLSKHMTSHKIKDNNSTEDNSNSPDIEWVWEDASDENPPLDKEESSVEDDIQDNETDMNNSEEENETAIEENENSNDEYVTDEPTRQSLTDEEDTESSNKGASNSNINENSMLNYRTFRKKVKSAHLKNLYACTECEYMCMFKDLFKKHVEKHFHRKIKKRMVCPTCRKVFHDKLKLKRHMKKHIKKVTYICRNCEFKTGQKELLRGHYEECLKRKLLYCMKCDFKSTSKWKLEEHMLSHIKPVFACTKCEFNCSNKEDLEIHIVIHSKWICKVCEYNCQSEKELFEHMPVHAVKARLACSKCKYVCSTQGVLTKHMVTHSNANKISCSECDYKCSSQQNLNRHMLVHSGKKVYECSHCEYICKLPSILKRHMQSHSGVVKLYACTVCKYVCNGAKKLEIHTKTHSQLNITTNNATSIVGSSVLKCADCNFTCTQEADLKAHMVMHENLNKLRCKYCASQFEDKKFLAAHMLSHKTTKNYRCPICKRSFSSETYLDKHMIMHDKTVPISKLTPNENKRNLDDSLQHEMSWDWNDDSNSVSQEELSVNELDVLPKKKQKKNSAPLVKYGFLAQDIDVKVSIQRLEHIKSSEIQTLFLRANLYSRFRVKSSAKKPTSKKLLNDTPDEASLYRSVKDNRGPFLIKEHVNPKMKIIKRNGENCFACSECFVYFKDKRNLLKHLKVDNTMFSCSECGKKYRYKFNLNRHLNREHNGELPSSKVDTHIVEENYTNIFEEDDTTSMFEEYFPCTKCEYSCSSNDELELHMLDHIEAESFTCLICKYNSVSKTDFETHLLNHTFEQDDSCESETTKNDSEQKSGTKNYKYDSMSNACLSSDDNGDNENAEILVNENSDSNLSCNDQEKHKTSKCDELKSNIFPHGRNQVELEVSKKGFYVPVDWSRKVFIRNASSPTGVNYEVCYFTPTGQRLYSKPQVYKYLKGNSNLSSKKIDVEKLDFTHEFCDEVSLANSEKSINQNTTVHSKNKVKQDVAQLEKNNAVDKKDIISKKDNEKRSAMGISLENVVGVTCLKCSKSFSTNGALRKHMKRIHGAKYKYCCSDCNFSCSKIENWKQHKLLHEESDLYKCQVCSKTFSEKHDLKIHKLKLHTYPLCCMECDYKCDSRENLMTHMEVHSNKLKFSCSECKFTCFNESDLEKHIQIHMIDYNDMETVNTLNKQKKNKEKHIQIHKNNYHDIDAVNTLTNQKKNTEKHIHIKKINHDDIGTVNTLTKQKKQTSIKCPKCKDTVPTLPALRKHLLDHLKDKPFKCSKCTCSFKRKFKLNQHILMKHNHFDCFECKYSTSSEKEFKIHLELHKDVKVGEDSKEHVALNSSENIFCCSDCDFTCPSQNYLIKHILTHNGQKSYVCFDCEYSFSSPDDLEKHIRMQLEEEMEREQCALSAVLPSKSIKSKNKVRSEKDDCSNLNIVKMLQNKGITVHSVSKRNFKGCIDSTKEIRKRTDTKNKNPLVALTIESVIKKYTDTDNKDYHEHQNVRVSAIINCTDKEGGNSNEDAHEAVSVNESFMSFIRNLTDKENENFDEALSVTGSDIEKFSEEENVSLEALGVSEGDRKVTDKENEGSHEASRVSEGDIGKRTDKENEDSFEGFSVSDNDIRKCTDTDGKDPLVALTIEVVIKKYTDTENKDYHEALSVSEGDRKGKDKENKDSHETLSVSEGNRKETDNETDDSHEGFSVSDNDIRKCTDTDGKDPLVALTIESVIKKYTDTEDKDYHEALSVSEGDRKGKEKENDDSHENLSVSESDRKDTDKENADSHEALSVSEGDKKDTDEENEDYHEALSLSEGDRKDTDRENTNSHEDLSVSEDEEEMEREQYAVSAVLPSKSVKSKNKVRSEKDDCSNLNIIKMLQSKGITVHEALGVSEGDRKDTGKENEDSHEALSVNEGDRKVTDKENKDSHETLSVNESDRKDTDKDNTNSHEALSVSEGDRKDTGKENEDSHEALIVSEGDRKNTDKENEVSHEDLSVSEGDRKDKDKENEDSHEALSVSEGNRKNTDKGNELSHEALSVSEGDRKNTEKGNEDSHEALSEGDFCNYEDNENEDSHEAQNVKKSYIRKCTDNEHENSHKESSEAVSVNESDIRRLAEEENEDSHEDLCESYIRNDKYKENEVAHEALNICESDIKKSKDKLNEDCHDPISLSVSDNRKCTDKENKLNVDKKVEKTGNDVNGRCMEMYSVNETQKDDTSFSVGKENNALKNKEKILDGIIKEKKDLEVENITSVNVNEVQQPPINDEKEKIAPKKRRLKLNRKNQFELNDDAMSYPNIMQSNINEEESNTKDIDKSVAEPSESILEKITNSKATERINANQNYDNIKDTSKGTEDEKGNPNIMQNDLNKDESNENKLDKSECETTESISENVVNDAKVKEKINTNKKESNRKSISKGTNDTKGDSNIMQLDRNEERMIKKDFDTSESGESTSENFAKNKEASEVINENENVSHIIGESDTFYEEQKHKPINESTNLCVDDEEKIVEEKALDLTNQIKNTSEKSEKMHRIKEKTVNEGKSSEKIKSETSESVSGYTLNDTESKKNINANEINTNIKEETDSFHEIQKKEQINNESAEMEVNTFKDHTCSLTGLIENTSEKSNKRNLVGNEKTDLCSRRNTVKPNKTCNTEKVRKISDYYTPKKHTKKQKIDITKCKQSEGKSKSVKIEDDHKNPNGIKEKKGTENCNVVEKDKRKEFAISDLNKSDKGENSDGETSSLKVEHWKRTLKRRASEISRMEEGLISSDKDTHSEVFNEENLKGDIQVKNSSEVDGSEFKGNVELKKSKNLKCKKIVKITDDPIEKTLNDKQQPKKKKLPQQVKKYSLRNR